MIGTITINEKGEFLDGLFATANIHRDRLLIAIDHLKTKIPLSSEDIEAFTIDDFLYWEMFISRFSKLQDLMGAKLFKAVLDYVGEPTDTMTVIDRLNALEKLGIIDNTHDWRDLRDMRNHLSHEYPDAPEITARNLNHAFALAPKLLETLEKLETFVRDVRQRNGM